MMLPATKYCADGGNNCPTCSREHHVHHCRGAVFVGRVGFEQCAHSVLNSLTTEEWAAAQNVKSHVLLLDPVEQRKV
jgi:hypothetical protein